MRIFLFVLALILITNAFGQVNQRFSLGMGYKVGFSQNGQPSKSQNLSQFSPEVSYALSLYSVINFSDENTRKLFSRLKLGLNGGRRSGIFEVDGVPTRISMSSLDVSLLLPVIAPLSDELSMQVGFGPYFSFVTQQNEGSPKLNVLQPGIELEFGLSAKHGSFLGFSVLQTFSDYSIVNFAVVFGLTVNDVRSSVDR